MRDVLSEVLDTVELDSTFYFRAELSSPFSVEVPTDHQVIRFHIATEGHCTVLLDDNTQLRLGPGDLVMIPHGVGHVLSDAPERPPQPLPKVLDAAGFDGSGPLVFGGGGERTTLVCGHFSLRPTLVHPFLATLPRVLHLRKGEGSGYAWIDQLLAHVDLEARDKVAGWQGVVERIAQILLISVLREQMSRSPESIGALAALTDDQIARAVEAVHERPGSDWTVESLAARAGMSRTVFARKFGESCGMSPMRYVTHWRMQRARLLLVSADVSAGEVASRVGYASEAAFSRAFKEHHGDPPGAFQRRARLEASKV